MLSAKHTKDEETISKLLPAAQLAESNPLDTLTRELGGACSPADPSAKLYPSNLVMEPFTAHSRWFLTSLVTSVALRGNTPYSALKT